jgi:hypothetical protein
MERPQPEDLPILEEWRKSVRRKIAPLTVGDDRIVPLTLDPYPWRTQIGTRGTYKEKYKDIIYFEPREGYEQDKAKYCPDYPAPCNCDDPETHGGH